METWNVTAARRRRSKMRKGRLLLTPRTLRLLIRLVRFFYWVVKLVIELVMWVKG